jgi:hypothetical protein
MVYHVKLLKKYVTFFFLQTLGVTADNASNNDKMIEHLAVLLETFPGAPNQTRCFAHILNLVAKTVLRQFEAPKKGKAGKAVDGKELAAVIDEIEGDDDKASESGTIDGDEYDDVDDDVVDDDDDGLPDELEELSEEELSRFKESVKPVRLVLTKVSQFI